jgi:hypothetical protein
MSRLALRGAVFLYLVAFGTGCGRDGAEEIGSGPVGEAQPPSGVAIQTGPREPFGGSPQHSTAEPAGRVPVPSAVAFGRLGAGGDSFAVSLRTPQTAAGHSRRIGREIFPITLRLRTPQLGQYPCTSCHVGGDLVVTPERIADAHQDIQPVHPAETGATCGTCHTANDVELLVLLSGERVPLDQAYRMCAQCHAPQVRDWEGGAHGKRLDGWRGERVVMNCADCHDPHRPAVEARIPYPGARLPARRGHE